jgi:hypothetical protein
MRTSRFDPTSARSDRKGARPSRRRRTLLGPQHAVESLEARCLLAVDLTLNPVSDINENGVATLTGSVSGLFANNEYSITVNWGDSTVETYNADGLNPAFRADAGGNDTFSVTHQYLDDNPTGTPQDAYPITVDLEESSILVGTDAVFVIDISGSTAGQAQGVTGVGDPNGDGSSNTILDAEIEAFRALNQDLISRGLGNIAKVSIVAFDATAQRLDMNPSTGAFDSFTSPSADTNNNGTPDVEDILKSLQTAGATNFEDALQKAIDAVNTAGTAPGEGSVIFLSDGFPNTPSTNTSIYADEASTIRNTLGQSLRAFGAGNGAQLGPLQVIDPAAQVFDNVQDLLDLFNGTGEQGGGTDSAHTTVTVHNLDPVITAADPNSTGINENGSVTLTGSFTDVGTLDTHTVMVAWGDGNVSAATVVQGAGSGTFSASHQYLDDNPSGTPSDNYSIVVTLKDDDTGTDVETLVVTVNNVAPVITAFASDAVECGNAGEDDPVTVTGSFTDVGTLDTHTAVVDWGDGHQTNLTAADLAGGVINASHPYAAGGLFTITITLTDDDTGKDVEQTLAIITGVGVLNGQLQIVGTDHDDHVTVNRTGNGLYKVHADFLPDSPRDVPAAGITSMVIVLCDGDDHATVAGTINLPTVIDGGEGADHLNGGRGPNVILGGGDDDMIVGGDGQDLLIGDAGADRIVGNQGDDIMIAGSATGPSGAGNPIVLYDELLDILLEWDSLRARAITRPKLTITGDADADVLTSSAGTDWFFYDFLEDVATDRKSDEVRENIG